MAEARFGCSDMGCSIGHLASPLDSFSGVVIYLGYLTLLTLADFLVTGSLFNLSMITRLIYLL